MNRAFLQAYDQYADAIFRHCYFRVFNRERAKELSQECFTRTWQYLADGGTIENIRAFLYRIANNLVIDESRKKKEQSLEDLQEAGFDAASDSFAENVHRVMEVEQLRHVLQELEPMYREVVTLRYVDGLGPKEIAAMLGESENVVSVRLHRGVKKVKELMQKYV